MALRRSPTSSCVSRTKGSCLKYLLGLALPVSVLAYLNWADDVGVVKWAVLAFVAVPCVVYLLLGSWEWDWRDAGVLAFLAWCLVSLAWSPDWRQGVVDLQHVALLAILYLTFRRVELPLWGIAAAALLAVTTFLPYGGTFNENTQAEFLIVCLPLLPRKGGFGLCLSALAVVILWFVLQKSDSHMGLIALGAVIGSFIISRLRYKPLYLLVFLSVVGVLVTLVLIEVPVVRWSFLSRVQLYAGTVEMWANSPLWGNGLGSFDYLWPHFQNADVKIFPGMGYLSANDATVFPGAAHNEFLQVLAETGIIGFGLFLAIVLPRWKRNPRVWASLGLLALFMATDQTLHDPEIAFLGAALLASVTPLSPKRVQVPVFAKLSAFPMLLAAFASVYLSVRHMDAEVRYGLSAQLHEKAPQIAFGEILDAYRTMPLDKRYRLQIFRSLSEGMLREKIKTDWQTVDLFYEISKTAIPEGAGLLISRMFILARGDRCLDECEKIVSVLKANDFRLWEVNAVMKAWAQRA